MGFTLLGVAKQAKQSWRLRIAGPLRTQPSDGGEAFMEVDTGWPRPMEGNLRKEI